MPQFTPRLRARRLISLALAALLAVTAIGAANARPASASAAVPLAYERIDPGRISLASQTLYDGSIDGSISLILWQSGDYNVQAHLHNGAKLKRSFTIGCSITSYDSGAKFVFVTGDEIGGTSFLSRGGSKYRDPVGNGHMYGVADDWGNLTRNVTPAEIAAHGMPYNFGHNFWAECSLWSKFDKAGLAKSLASGVQTGAGAIATVVGWF